MKTVCRLLPFAIAASAFADNTFFLNEAGYDLGKPFSAVVQSTEELEGTKWSIYYLRDNWSKSGKYYRIEIPYGFLYEGTYYIDDVTGSPSKSQEFTVGGNQLAKSTLSMVMDYFYNDRANKDPIIGWDQKVSVYGSDGVTRDVRGGWYDASGDVSKYLSHLSYANYLNPQQIPLTVWSLAFVAERIPALLNSTSTKAKTADEAAYGARRAGIFLHDRIRQLGSKFPQAVRLFRFPRRVEHQLPDRIPRRWRHGHCSTRPSL